MVKCTWLGEGGGSGAAIGFRGFWAAPVSITDEILRNPALELTETWYLRVLDVGR